MHMYLYTDSKKRDTYLQCVCNDQVPGRCWVDPEQHFIVVWLTCWRWVVLWRHWTVCLCTRTHFVPEFLHSLHRCSSTHSHGLWANSNSLNSLMWRLLTTLCWTSDMYHWDVPRRLCFCLHLYVCLSVCLSIYPRENWKGCGGNWIIFFCRDGMSD